MELVVDTASADHFEWSGVREARGPDTFGKLSVTLSALMGEGNRRAAIERLERIERTLVACSSGGVANRLLHANITLPVDNCSYNRAPNRQFTKLLLNQAYKLERIRQCQNFLRSNYNKASTFPQCRSYDAVRCG
jgi:hypothetical protein